MDAAGLERARVVLMILNDGNLKQLQSLKSVGKQRAQQILDGRTQANAVIRNVVIFLNFFKISIFF